MSENFRNMTVKDLKALAKVRIGAGYSKLRTKAALVEALEKLSAASSSSAAQQTAAKSAGASEVRSPKKAAVPTDMPKSAASARGRGASRRAAAVPEAVPAAMKPAKTSQTHQTKKTDVVAAEAAVPRTSKKAAEKQNLIHASPSPAPTASQASPASKAASPASAFASPVSSPAPQKAPQAKTSGGILSDAGRDLIQAYGKARSQCSDPFFLNDAMEGILPEDEALGELPESYGEESLVLISKGPYALYLYWDFSGATLERLAAMDGAVTCLRLFAGEQMIRELECTLHDRSWYFHGLQPGLRYRVELVAVDRNGHSERIGPSSNTVTLPPGTPSPLIDDRFVRLPFDASSMSIAEALSTQETRSTASREQSQFSMTLRSLIFQASGGRMPSPSGSSEQWPLPSSFSENGEASESAQSSSFLKNPFSDPPLPDPKKDGS